MTEYEFMDLSVAYADTAISALMGYFTVLSTYFIVAYAVGSSLNRSQVTAVNGLFLVMALFLTWGGTSYLYVSHDYRMLAGGLDPGLAGWKVVLPLFLIGVVSGLKFMWDIRHPKPD